MTTPTQTPNLHDDRWGGYVPWFLRHPDLEHLGQFDLLFSRVGHRLAQFFLFSEGGPLNLGHMGARIESESHQCFRFKTHETLPAQIESFFAPTQIQTETEKMTQEDLLVKLFAATHKTSVRAEHIITDKGKITLSAEYLAEQKQFDEFCAPRRALYRRQVISGRLTVLESVLRLVMNTAGFFQLKADLRRYLAEAHIMLDITENPAKIVPMEEPLLQNEVINRLLPRLATNFPQQEKDLVKAYHDLVQGRDTDAIFVLAIKALEEIARQLSGRPQLTLDDHKDIKAAFPNLHPTIYTTILKLAAHRGDKAGHGRQGPPPHEMRYLLFSICNVALLFLDYPSPTIPASAL